MLKTITVAIIVGLIFTPGRISATSEAAPVEIVKSKLPQKLDLPQSAPIETTLCHLIKTPEDFHGDVVQFKATVSRGYERSELLDSSCPNGGIWLALGVSGVSKEDITFDTLLSDANFRKFQRLLVKRDSVVVTVIGRFMDAASMHGISGFGHLGRWRSQFVLHRVLEVRTN